MDKKDILPYLEKDVKIVLKNQFTFNSKVLEVTDTAVRIYDMHGDTITIDINDIMFIKDQNGRRE